MADNPRYQRQNIQLDNTQPFDFANLKETIKLSKSTEAGLNRIAEFAFKSQSEKAKKAGLEYGVANPPSLTQISEAQAQGKDIKDIFSEDYTVFGEAARGAQAAALRTDLEGQARDEFSRMMAGINTTDISQLDMVNIRSNLDAIINGHSKVLAQVGAEESLKYRQSVTVLGHAVYKSALDRVESLVKAENIVKVDEQLKTLKSNIPVLLEAYPTFEEFDLALSLDKKTLKDMMMNIDAAKIPEYNKEMDKVIKNAIMDRIGDYALKDRTFAGTAGEAAIKISEGQAGDYTSFLHKYVPEDEWIEVIKRKTEKSAKQYGLIEANEKITKKLKEDDFRLIMRDFYNGKIGPDETIKALDAKEIPYSNDEYKAIISSQDETPGNLEIYSKMINRVNVDSLSIGEIDAATKAHRITYKQGLALKDKYFTRTDNDRDIKQAVLTTLQITNDQMLLLKPEKDALVAKGIASTTKEANELRAKGVPFNLAELAKKNTMAIADDNATAEYNQAKADLLKMSQTYNFQYSEDAYEAKDVDSTFKKIPKKDRQMIKRALRGIDTYKMQQKNKANY